MRFASRDRLTGVVYNIVKSFINTYRIDSGVLLLAYHIKLALTPRIRKSALKPSTT